MYYIIQENLFREYHFKTLIEYLNRYKLEYEIVKYRPFLEEFEFKTDRKDVWVFGSTNLATSIKDSYGWNPGSMYNENHDAEVYMSKYGEHMLNHDAKILGFFDEIPEDVPYAFFARPAGDTKIFNGEPFTKDSWKKYIDEIKNPEVIEKYKDSKIIVAPLKTTQQEIRCWVVGGKIATISQYKIGGRVVYQNMDNNEEAQIFCNKMIKIFQPAKAFVMDICLHNDDYKIVEINCINCSGFYDGDMSKLIQALENTFKTN